MPTLRLCTIGETAERKLTASRRVRGNGSLTNIRALTKTGRQIFTLSSMPTRQINITQNSRDCTDIVPRIRVIAQVTNMFSSMMDHGNGSLKFMTASDPIANAVAAIHGRYGPTSRLSGAAPAVGCFAVSGLISPVKAELFRGHTPDCVPLRASHPAPIRRSAHRPRSAELAQFASSPACIAFSGAPTPPGNTAILMRTGPSIRDLDLLNGDSTFILGRSRPKMRVRTCRQPGAPIRQQESRK